MRREWFKFSILVEMVIRIPQDRVEPVRAALLAAVRTVPFLDAVSANDDYARIDEVRATVKCEHLKP